MAESYPFSEGDMSRFAATVLGVSDLLEQRGEDNKTLTFDERQIILDGLEYLRLVRSGQETVQASGASIVAGDERLSAYEETSRALYLARSGSAIPVRKQTLIDTSVAVLSGLLEGNALSEMDADAVEKTRNLFSTLQEYHFRGRTTRSDSTLDRCYDTWE